MVNNILKTLEEKANKIIDLILEEEEKGLLDLMEDFKKKSAEKKAKEKEELERALQKEMFALSQQLSFKYNLETQAKKAECLKEAYSVAQKKLANLSEKEMAEFLKRLVRPLLGKEGVFLAGKKTAPLLKKILENKGLTIEEGLKEEGFIFQGETVEIDFRFQEFLKELKEKIEPKLAKIIYA
ncbi:hypothetical protein L6252_02985 [Candidatus Parcubacteria bacterium]|nr:hypothetical protein [Candidatus Parcubacteria bacterium]